MRSSVGLREFRASLADYVASGTPVAVTRHGQTVGWFIPTPDSKAAEVASLRAAGKALDALLAHHRGEDDDAAGSSTTTEERAAPASADARVYVRDVKPYAVPASLDDLVGPATGELILPHSVMWAPGDGRVDLDVPGGASLAYRALLSEGSLEDIHGLVNKVRLRAVWGDLLLPRRVRSLWEAAFPELRRHR